MPRVCLEHVDSKELTASYLDEKQQGVLGQPPHGMRLDRGDGGPSLGVGVDHGADQVDRLGPVGQGGEVGAPTQDVVVTLKGGTKGVGASWTMTVASAAHRTPSTCSQNDNEE